MNQLPRVSFLGAGKIGSALATLIKREQVPVLQWDTDLSKVPDQKPFSEVVSMADVLFFCVPSWLLRGVIKSALPHLSKKTVCVFLSKGIDAKTKQFVPDLAKEVLPRGQKIVLLSGPMLAGELAQGGGGAACIATASAQTAQVIQSLFHPSDLSLTYAPDLKSVAICGVLKNVYAIALGIADGLEWGANRKGWLCAQSLQEMIEIVRTLRGNPSYVLSEAGVGDFIATGMSPLSSNHAYGRDLVLQKSRACKSEGCESLPSLVKMLGAKKLSTFPVLSAVSAIVEKEKNAKKEFDSMVCL